MFGHFCDLGNVLSVCVYIYIYAYVHLLEWPCFVTLFIL